MTASFTLFPRDKLADSGDEPSVALHWACERNSDGLSTARPWV